MNIKRCFVPRSGSDQGARWSLLELNAHPSLAICHGNVLMSFDGNYHQTHSRCLIKCWGTMNDTQGLGRYTSKSSVSILLAWLGQSIRSGLALRPHGMDIFTLFPLHWPGRKNPLSITVTAAFSTRNYAVLWRLPVIPPNHRDYFFPKFSKKKARHREISLVQGQRDYSAMEGVRF